MVSLDEVRASNTKLTASTAPRVAVFVGATDGIDKATLQQLVSLGFPLRVYIVGRNEAAFRPVLDELRCQNKAAELVFLQGQVSLLSETKRITDEIISRESSIDLLFHSAGFLPYRGNEKTSEGLELVSAVAYYSKQIFFQRLLPLLRTAATATANSGVDSYRPRLINVLGTGPETTVLFLDDLDLEAPGRLTIPNFISHLSSRTSLAMRRLAERAENGGVVVVHLHPGLVTTELFRKSWGDQWAEDKAPNFPHLLHTTVEESGERMLYVITSAKYGGEGVPLREGQEKGMTVRGTPRGSLFCVGDRLETLDNGGVLDELESSGAGDVIWDKTNEVIARYL